MGCQETSVVAPLATPVLRSGFGAPFDKQVQRVPVAFQLSGPCTPEIIDVRGSLLVTTTLWGDADALRIRTHLSGNLAGRGLSTGLGYRYQQVTNTDLDLDFTSGASESDQIFHFRIISATSEPDYHMEMNGTFIFDPVLGSQFVPKRWTAVCR